MRTPLTIAHIEVRIDNDAFLLSTESGRAVAVARALARDEFELLWLAPQWPQSVVLDVLETAGFSVQEPHARVM